MAFPHRLPSFFRESKFQLFKGILSFIYIWYQFNLPHQFLIDFFQNKIINDKSKDGALWSILCSTLPYMLGIKKKNNERYRTIQSIVLKLI